jgi:predicted GNAT family acetyltransferase
MSQPSPTFQFVPDRSRYTLELDGRVIGKALYGDEGATRTFVHTEVDAEFTGHGLATSLIAQAVAHSREAGKTVQATCPLVAAYLDKNPA